jgi:hypothetical protein
MTYYSGNAPRDLRAVALVDILILFPLIPNFNPLQVQLSPSMEPVSRVLAQLVEVSARVYDVGVGIVASRVSKIAHPIGCHVASTHDILADLIDAVPFCVSSVSHCL